jgi:hypothetical protein
VKNLLEEEPLAMHGSGRPDLKSLELARDAPANLDWLHRNRRAYPGEWVALHKGRLIAHGKNGLYVFHAAQSQGINPPLMHRIAPDESASRGGWQAGAEAQLSNRVSVQRRTRNSRSSGIAVAFFSDCMQKLLGLWWSPAPRFGFRQLQAAFALTRTGWLWAFSES